MEKNQKKENNNSALKKASFKTQTTFTVDTSKLERRQIYTNADLMEIFAISGQGGMRRSHRTNSLVLISNHHRSKERNPYEDKWINGVFHYTGMGMIGDQNINDRQNRTLAESNENEVSVYLFESFRTNEYTYIGKVYLAGTPYYVEEVDSNSNLRKVIKFPVSLVEHE